MLKVLKWEIIKRLQENKYFYLIFFVIFILCIFMPLENKYSSVFALVSSLYGGVFFITMFINMLFLTISDLRKSYAALEKSIDKNPWEIIAAKIIHNIIVVIILYFLTKLLSKFLERFATENSKYLTVDLEFEMVFIYVIYLPLLVLFYYLLALRLPITKNLPILATTVFVVGTAIVISYLLNLSFLQYNFIANIENYIFAIGTIIGLFIGSCILYEKHYEVQ